MILFNERSPARIAALVGSVLFSWAAASSAQTPAGPATNPVESRPPGPLPAALRRPATLVPLSRSAIRHVDEPAPRPPSPQNPAAAPKLVRVPLSLMGKRIDEVQVMGGRLKPLGDGDRHVAELAPGDQLIVAPKIDSNPSVVLRPATRAQLSGLVIRPQTGADTVSISRVFAEMQGKPVWTKARDSYKVDLLLGLEPDDNNAHVPGPLKRPIELHLRADIGSFEPAKVSIDSEGVAGYRSVAFFCATDANKDRVQVTFDILGDMGRNQQTIEVKRNLDKLVIKPTYQSIAGLGFGSTSLRIERMAEDGELLPDLASLDVPLFSSGGILSRPQVAIPKGMAFAQVEFRSAGLGEAHLEAGSGDWKSPSIVVFMQTPFGAIIAIVLGGLTGGVLHMLRKRPRRKAWIIEGVLVGAVTLAVLSFKPDLMALVSSALGTELGAFGLAAFAGLLGTPLLDKLAAAVFPGLAAIEKSAKASKG